MEVLDEKAARHVEYALEKRQHYTAIDIHRACDIKVTCQPVKFLAAPRFANALEFGSHGIVPQARVLVEKTIEIVVGSESKLSQRRGQGWMKRISDSGEMEGIFPLQLCLPVVPVRPMPMTRTFISLWRRPLSTDVA